MLFLASALIALAATLIARQARDQHRKSPRATDSSCLYLPSKNCCQLINNTGYQSNVSAQHYMKEFETKELYP
jgi:hypothetical protein